VSPDWVEHVEHHAELDSVADAPISVAGNPADFLKNFSENPH
jgi:hypothetical protein